MDDASYLIFYETWHTLAEGRDTDAKRLAFYDAIFRYAFEGVEPPKPIRGESPGEAWAAYDAFVVAKPVIDRYRKKVAAGRAGKGISRNAGNKNACKPTPKSKQNQSKNKAEIKQNQSENKGLRNSALNINKNIKEESITSNIPTGLITKSNVFKSVCNGAQGAHTHTIQTNEIIEDKAGTDLSGDLPPEERPPTVPTDAELEMAATQIKIPADYIPAFVEDMQRLGWGYIHRGGEFVQLNRRNCKAILSAFWRNRKKEQTRNQNNQAETIGVKLETTDDYENRF